MSEPVKVPRYRLREGHCKDCCCARSWEALGGQIHPGTSIVGCIEGLRENAARARSEIAARDRTIEGLRAKLVPNGWAWRSDVAAPNDLGPVIYGSEHERPFGDSHWVRVAVVEVEP